MVDIFVDYPFTARMRFRVMYCVRVLLNLLNYSYTKATEQSPSVVLLACFTKWLLILVLRMKHFWVLFITMYNVVITLNLCLKSGIILNLLFFEIL